MDKIELEELKNRFSEVFRRNRVKKAVLFGSAARGTESKKSDLDIMIVVETDKRFFDRYDDFLDLYQMGGPRGLDLLIYTPEELESISHRRFIRGILTEGKTLYEQ
ncbi:MAG: nucleotidyltransferase domain-containing protein [Deltaproteobacteria bacterium]|nr:nucleotidyltransferase domain-containing protein [Deltaproteobacteria bacterium]